jgi:3-isopropylmalate/(R)-2-methylmalate dehydratase small subunit
MQKFTTLTATAAPLPLMNVDTDMIIPKQFLKTIKRTGLGSALFHELRTNPDGSEKAEFVLNKPPYRTAEILVAGENFGCGSSREHAPWALLDFGICCVIAPSFADIFYNNSFKNGILPVILPKPQVEALMKEAEAGRPVTVSLEDNTVRCGNEHVYAFTTDAFRRRCLLEGLDDIGLTLEHKGSIASFEESQKAAQPWLYNR